MYIGERHVTRKTASFPTNLHRKRSSGPAHPVYCSQCATRRASAALSKYGSIVSVKGCKECHLDSGANSCSLTKSLRSHPLQPCTGACLTRRSSALFSTQQRGSSTRCLFSRAAVTRATHYSAPQVSLPPRAPLSACAANNICWANQPRLPHLRRNLHPNLKLMGTNVGSLTQGCGMYTPA